jgi:glucose-1-phosphate thymidylyltransferase
MALPPLGVLLTAGMGTRLRPLTPDLPKSLVPLLNRPLVSYGLDLLAGMGLRDLVVVVGGSDSRTGPAALQQAPLGTTVTLAEQPEPRGSGDAVVSVGAPLDDRAVVVLAVDTVLRGGDLAGQLAAFEASHYAAWLPLHQTDRPREMGIALLEGDHIVSLEEKPQEPKSDLACVGLWMLGPQAVERIRTNPVINPKGESDLTATIGALLGEGAAIGGRRFEGDWLDGGSLAGLLQAQSALFQALPPVSYSADRMAETHGSNIVRSQLQGPVLVGERARLEDCTLGPEVVIGEDVVLHGVHLQRALVAPGAHLAGGTYSDVVITRSGEVASAV